MTKLDALLNDENIAVRIFQATLKSAEKGSPAAQRTIAQIVGILTEKQEIVHKNEFTSDELIELGNRIILRQRGIFAAGGRNCPVCGRPPLLHEEIRVDSGCSPTESSQVATMALPSPDAPGLPGQPGNSDSQVAPDRDNVVDSNVLHLEGDIPF